VMGVPINETRAIFEESLDIVLKAWSPEEFTYKGEHFDIPSVRIWPTPVQPPSAVLLQAVNSPESLESSIRRGLPALMARVLGRYDEQVEEFVQYRAALAAAGVDPEPFLDRTTVLKYALVAPTRQEAKDLSRDGLEWDLEILQKLTTPTATEMPQGYEMYEKRGGQLPDRTYDDWAENVMMFDDPAGCIEKIGMLREAGVRRLLLWMGVGGLDHDVIVRSMRLFAEEVMPRFR
jgi:alkanesulfonate monooxygenase SsuD/methylene tetrahydromethanopterin reductase-like flavin-dependent oxidoreductase (luciferase family)